MRRMILVVISLALLAGLTGFSPAGMTVGVQAQDDDPLRVFWMRGPSDTEDIVTLLEGFAADFTAETGVPVALEFVDWAEGRERIHAAFEDGQPPDISVIGARWVPEFVAAGYIEPLDRYISRDFRREFIPAIIDEGAVYQGRTFGLPVATSTRALYYNIDILEAAGVDGPPESWDELLAAGKKINALEDDVYGFGLQAGPGLETNTYFYYFVWGNGGNLYNASNTASALDEPAAVEALAFMKRLVDEGATQPNPLDYDRRARLEVDFVAGKAGMIITGSWVAGRLRRDFPDVNFGVAPIPYNTTPATYGVIDTLVMFKTSERKADAWAFMEFLYDVDRRVAYTSTVGVLPAMEAVADRLAAEDNPDYPVFMALLDDARFEPLHRESEVIAEAVIEAVVAVHEGDDSPEVALENAATEIDQLLRTSSAGW